MKFHLKYIFIVSLYITLPKLLCAQDREVDSLKHCLLSVLNDTIKIKILNQLANSAPGDEWIEYSKKMKQLAEFGLKKEEVKHNSKLQRFYKRHFALAINNEGFLATEKGNMTEAFSKFKSSLELFIEIHDKSGEAEALNNIAVIKNTNADINGAIECYHRSLKIKEELKDQKGIATTLNNLGNIYQGQGDYVAALKYYKEGLRLEEQLHNENGIGSSLNNIGSVYDNRKQYDSALVWYFKSVAIKEKLNQEYSLSQSYNNIGVSYDRKGDFENALSYYYKTLAIRRKFKDMLGISNTLNNIGWVHFHKDNTKEALSFSDSSMILAKKNGVPSLIRNAAELLKKIYSKTNNHKKALEYFELEIKMQDSISNVNSRKAGVKSQLKYEYEKQAAADSVKNAEEQKVKDAQLQVQSASLKQEKIQRYALYGGLGLIVGFLIFVINRFRTIQKQKKIIEIHKIRVDLAYDKLHEKNKEVIDSIYYAQRIQKALITSEKYFEKQLNRLDKKD